MRKILTGILTGLTNVVKPLWSKLADSIGKYLQSRWWVYTCLLYPGITIIGLIWSFFGGPLSFEYLCSQLFWRTLVAFFGIITMNHDTYQEVSRDSDSMLVVNVGWVVLPFVFLFALIGQIFFSGFHIIAIIANVTYITGFSVAMFYYFHKVHNSNG